MSEFRDDVLRYDPKNSSGIHVSNSISGKEEAVKRMNLNA